MSLGCDSTFIANSLSWSPEKLSELEVDISQALNLNPWDISVSPAPAARRWSVPDLNIETADGSLHPITEILPELQQSATSYAAIALNVVVCVCDEARQAVTQSKADQKAVREILSV